MPCIFQFCSNIIPSRTPMSTSSSSPESTVTVIADIRPVGRRPLIITITARTLSSVGFGLSILALWLSWLCPSATVVPTAQEKDKLAEKIARRRSTPSMPLKTPRPPNDRRVSAPMTLSSIILAPGGDTSQNRARHVYFIDSPPPATQAPIPQSSDVTEPEPPNRDLEPEQISSFTPLSSPPLANTLIEEITTHPAKVATLYQDNDSITESESSRHSSRRHSLNTQIPRMKVFVGKHRQTPESTDSNASSSTSVSTAPQLDDIAKPSRRYSTPWSLARPRTAPEMKSKTNTTRLSFRRRFSNETPSSSLNSTPSPPRSNTPASYFSRNNQRRASMPVPRTSPYEAPYFATPPSPLGSISQQLPPETDADATNQKLEASEPILLRESRHVNTEAQASLGHSWRLTK
ncbi:hypothetical protein BD779DRAFT_60578 [Infundibulicybe gibba]|nr:hypothetical protein BD779DRAFT_60578 [Infundibulicybe gibba]